MNTTLNRTIKRKIGKTIELILEAQQELEEIQARRKKRQALLDLTLEKNDPNFDMQP